MSLSSRNGFRQTALSSFTSSSSSLSTSNNQAPRIAALAAPNQMITYNIKNFSQQGTKRLISEKKLIHGKYWEIFVDPIGDGTPGYLSVHLSMHENSSFCYVNGNGVIYSFTFVNYSPY